MWKCLPDQNILQFHSVFLCVASGQLLWCPVIEQHTLVHGPSFRDTALQDGDAEGQVDQSEKHLDPTDPSEASIVNVVRTAETILYSLQENEVLFDYDRDGKSLSMPMKEESNG
jgi:4-hydroxyphenylpyruvate dioxygenase-like putative hemolysin